MVAANGNGNGKPRKPNPKKAAFLAAYRTCGMVTRAAEAAEIDHSSHYRWLQSDPEYAEEFEQAQRDSCSVLEAEARRRALEGVSEPVYQMGQCVGHKQKYSDTLLIFLMKANNPSKFGDRIETRHSGAVAQPVQFVMPEGRRSLNNTNGASSN